MWSKIKNFFYYGWQFRNTVEYCATTTYDAIHIKLDRIYNNMVNHSHLLWNSDINNTEMRKLCEAKNLAKILSDIAKWEGRHITKFMDRYTYDRTGEVFFVNPRRKNNKIIDRKLYSFFLKKAIARDNNLYKSRKKRLFQLLETHIDIWWD